MALRIQPDVLHQTLENEMNAIKRSLAALLLIALAGPAAGKSTDVEKIDVLVKKSAELDLFSGTVLVAERGKVIYASAQGMANRDYQLPNSLDTRFNIGSIGKTLTGVAVMQLVQTGKLALGDSLGKHLPDFPFAEKDQITLQHLLNHSSGLGNYMEHPEYGKHLHAEQISELLPLIFDQPPQFAAGSRFAYSNSGMVLLGRVVEKASGLSYADYLRQRILIPAGMQATELAQEQDVLPHRAVGYTPVGGGRYLGNVRRIMPASADGGLRTTVGDLLKFDQALYDDRLLDAAHRSQMFTPSGPHPHLASGWFSADMKGHRAVGHSGGAPGVSAEFRRYIDDGLTLVVLSNYDNVATQLAERIEAVLFELPVSMPTANEAQHAIAQNLIDLDRTSAALAVFDALAADPEPDLNALYQSARLRIVSNMEPKQAVKSLARYIELAGPGAEPSVAAARWRQGNAYEQLGEREQAKLSYQQALKDDPQLEEAAQALAKLAGH